MISLLRLTVYCQTGHITRVGVVDLCLQLISYLGYSEAIFTFHHVKLMKYHLILDIGIESYVTSV